MDGSIHIRKAYESILGNDFEQAIDWFEQAIELEPNNASYHYRLSITYARSNKLPQAIKHAEEACRLEPDDNHYVAQLHHLQARELIRLAEPYCGQTGHEPYMAVAYLQKAVALDPLAAEAYVLMAIAYAQLDDYDKALLAVKELLKLDPHHDAGNRLLTLYREKIHQQFNLTSNQHNE